MTFDPVTATAGYIDSLGEEALLRAAAYTAGSQWLILWGLLVSVLVCWGVLRSGLLATIDRRLAARGRGVRDVLIASSYALMASAISLPWTLYEGWHREIAYGRSSQSLQDYLWQWLVGALVSALLTGLFFGAVYALVRRAGKRWWIWSGGLTAIAACTLLVLGPIVIEPLFNRFEPLPKGEVRDALEVLARQSGVREDRIYVYDGSRQSNNFTANVSGIGGTARIAISDVALKGASLDEVKAVTGHEIGHYVIGQIWRMVGLAAVLAMLVFWAADRVFDRVARVFGCVATIDNPVSLPVLVFVAGLMTQLCQPVMNALVRSGETAADRYSLEIVGLPDALATALLKTAEYRDPRPHPLQEILFYSHPSVERRIEAAMRWKADAIAPGASRAHDHSPTR